MVGWWNNEPKTLAEKGYFKKALTDRQVLRYMRLFYKTIFRHARSSCLTIRRMTLYTCQYVFPPSRGHPKGYACIDETYGLPDPDCPACNGGGHPIKADKYREIKVMGLIVSFTPEERTPELFGKVTVNADKLIVGLPIPPEYTARFGLKPKTDVLDKAGNVIERDVFIGYKIENDDTVIRTEDFWDGQVNRVVETEFIVSKVLFNQQSIGYHKMLQVFAVQQKNTGDDDIPQRQF